MVRVIKRQHWNQKNYNITKEDTYEELDKEKVRNRIKFLAVGSDGKGGEDVDPCSNIKSGRKIIKIGRPLNNINIDELASRVISFIVDGTKTCDIDLYTIKCCIDNYIQSSEYEELAVRIYISAIHKETPWSFEDVCRFSLFVQTKSGETAPQIREDILLLAMQHRAAIENHINHRRNYNLGFFGLITLIRPGKIGYLTKDINGNIIERPQHLWYRVAIEIHHVDLRKVSGFNNALALIKITYDLMSLRYMTHATPTLTNSGTEKNQLASCNLLQVREDSVEGIGDTFKDIMVLSKNGAGIGVDWSCIRANGSIIKSTGGISRGIVQFIRMFDTMAVSIDQGGTGRPSAIAFYLPTWHADYIDFINLPRNTQAAPEKRAKHLFYGAVVDDIFMEKCEIECDCTSDNCPGMYHMFSPDEMLGLNEKFGAEFRRFYMMGVAQKKYRSAMHACQIMKEMLGTIVNCSKLYIFDKDNANRANNLSNVGPIKNSNLCMEICEPVGPDMISVCNLASIKLDMFGGVINSGNYFNDIDYLKGSKITLIRGYDFDGNKINCWFSFEAMGRVVKTLVRNLDNIIDITYYPEEKTKKTNLSMRPIGIGVQGLADLFNVLGLPYESIEAQLLNYYIWYWMYYYAMEATIELAKERGTYPLMYVNGGSPAANGKLQFDMWNEGLMPAHVDVSGLFLEQSLDQWDGGLLEDARTKIWDNIRNGVAKYGMRNSLLLAPMPTASTSQILGSAESFEPYTSNIFTRTTISGQVQIVNPTLRKELEKRNLWSRETIDNIILNSGSVSQLPISDHAKAVYKTAYEISLKRYVRMAADRGRFICQSQSLNLYVKGSTEEVIQKLYSAIIDGHKYGNKTLLYYARIFTETGQKVNIDKSAVDKFREMMAAAKQKALAGNCETCSA